MNKTILLIVVACTAYGQAIVALAHNQLGMLGFIVLVVGGFCIGWTITDLRHGRRP